VIATTTLILLPLIRRSLLPLYYIYACARMTFVSVRKLHGISTVSLLLVKIWPYVKENSALITFRLTLVASKFSCISTNLPFIIRKRTLFPYVLKVSDFVLLYGVRLASRYKRLRSDLSAALGIITFFKCIYYLPDFGARAKRPLKCEIAILKYDTTRSGLLLLKRL
jgi:hypothetical protein